MGVRILYDDGQAAMYCSTSDWAFGPIFHDDGSHTADERVEFFLRWLDTIGGEHWDSYEKTPARGGHQGHGRDPRCLTQAALQEAYEDWAKQEAEQWAAAATAEDDVAQHRSNGEEIH